MIRKSKDNLTSLFKILIEELWPNKKKFKNKYYAPKEFKNKISKMNPLFKDNGASDAKDLVSFILMALHQELNKAKKINNINNNRIIDQCNKKEMLKYYVEKFALNNKSIISDLFHATKCKITECSKCCIMLYDYQNYSFIIFPLEEVWKFK